MTGTSSTRRSRAPALAQPQPSSRSPSASPVLASPLVAPAAPVLAVFGPGSVVGSMSVADEDDPPSLAPVEPVAPVAPVEPVPVESVEPVEPVEPSVSPPLELDVPPSDHEQYAASRA